MPAERAGLEAALDRLALDLRGLADTLPCIDALEAYLDLARPLVDECEGCDRPWVNARVEEIWSACPAVACRWGGRQPQWHPGHPLAPRQAKAASVQERNDFARVEGVGIDRH